MTIQQWHTLVKLEYQKCNFPSAVDDRLQRDIFVIGLNDTVKPFRNDLISRENLTTLTFAQVISKARDFEASLNTESAITRQQLEESVHQVDTRWGYSIQSDTQCNQIQNPTAFFQTTMCPCLPLVRTHTTCSSSWLSCRQ